jgi:hypothetical protein
MFGGRQVGFGKDAAKGAALLRKVDRLRAGADDRDAYIFEPLR